MGKYLLVKNKFKKSLGIFESWYVLFCYRRIKVEWKFSRIMPRK